MSLSALLLPEFHDEMKKTRSTLEALPEGNGDFRVHERSTPLNKLAGHLAQLPSIVSLILTGPDFDFAVNRMEPLVFETKPQILAEFDELADHALTHLKLASDELFEQPWKLSAGAQTIFSGTRYMGYRTLGINHIVHHRAQLGVSLRLLNLPVPSIYGPSADTPTGG